MTDTDALTERLWEAVAEVRDRHPRVFNDAPTDDVIAAVLPIVAVELRAAEAEALREAAEWAERDLGWASGGHTSTYSVRHWLRERADQIETGDQR